MLTLPDQMFLTPFGLLVVWKGVSQLIAASGVQPVAVRPRNRLGSRRRHNGHQ